MTYWEDSLEFAFRCEEAAGTSRLSTYGADVAVESGGNVARVASWIDSFAISPSRADNTGLFVADRAGIRIVGDSSWTLHYPLVFHYASGAFVGFFGKGGNLYAGWGGGNIHVVIGGTEFAVGVGFGGTDGALFDIVVRYNHLTGEANVRIGGSDLGTAAVTLPDADDAETDDWALHGAAVYGQGNHDADEISFWSKYLDDGRVTALIAGKLISAFNADAPNLSNNRTWVRAVVGRAGSHQLVNDGGDPDASAGWAITSGSLPTGFDFDVDAGLISWDESAVDGETASVEFTATKTGLGSSACTLTLSSEALLGTGNFSCTPPDCRIDETRGVGVIADGAGDPVVAAVFVTDGGIPTTVESESINPDTGQPEWWHTVNPAAFDDGLHTCVATIQHESGIERVVSTTFLTDADGTIGTSRDRYVDPAATDNSANGLTTGTPKRDVWAAALSIGECGGGTIYMKGMNAFDRAGLGGSITLADGVLRFKAWPGEAFESCGFDSGDSGDRISVVGGGTIELEDLVVDAVDLNANNADGLKMVWTGHTGLEGPGRTTGAIQGVSGDSWPNGFWRRGRVCVAGLEDQHWGYWRNNPRGPQSFHHVNVKDHDLGNQAYADSHVLSGFDCENIDATGTDDGGGNPFHNEGIQIGFDGGDWNGHYQNGVFRKCRVALLFHRQNLNETTPTKNIVVKNIRYDDDDFEGGKYLWCSGPHMGVKIENVTAPRTNLRLQNNPADFSNRLVRISHVEIRGNVFYDYNLTSVGFNGTSDDPCDDLTIDWNAGVGGVPDRGTDDSIVTMVDAFNLASTYDFTPKIGGPLDRVMPRGGNAFAVGSLERDDPTSIGAYRSSAETGGVETVPDLTYATPQTWERNVAITPVVPSVSGDAATSASVTTGALPSGVAPAATGTLTGTPTAAGSGTAKITGANGAGTGAESNLISWTVTPHRPILGNYVGGGALNVRDTVHATCANTGDDGVWTEVSGTSLAAFGLTLNPANGDIDGNLSAVGSIDTVVQCANAGGTVTKHFTATVSNILPVITYSTVYVYGAAQTLLPETSSGGIIPATGAYSLVSGSLPTGKGPINADSGGVPGTATVLGQTGTATFRATNTIGNGDYVQNWRVVPADDEDALPIPAGVVAASVVESSSCGGSI